MSDKLKLIVAGSATAVLLLLAMLVPLAFRNGEETAAPGTLGERASLFAAYWDGSDEVNWKKIEKPSKQQEKAGAQLLETLVEEIVPDKRLTEAAPGGREYVRVSNDLLSMDLCRMWMSAQGDWQNWLDLYFDLDTGDIYYLYLSSECLFNGNDYLDEPAAFDAENVADRIGEWIGYDLRYLVWSGDPTDTATAVYMAGGSSVCVDISCTYYRATLIDVKIRCV
ncbi:MAG: hypothetical protein ACI4PC_02310 [Oscillospiraceae bacterium]